MRGRKLFVSAMGVSLVFAAQSYAGKGNVKSHSVFDPYSLTRVETTPVVSFTSLILNPFGSASTSSASPSVQVSSATGQRSGFKPKHPNNGVGNGSEDGQPGHSHNNNDAPGTGPGHPGSA